MPNAPAEVMYGVQVVQGQPVLYKLLGFLEDADSFTVTGYTVLAAAITTDWGKSGLPVLAPERNPRAGWFFSTDLREAAQHCATKLDYALLPTITPQPPAGIRTEQPVILHLAIVIETGEARAVAAGLPEIYATAARLFPHMVVMQFVGDSIPAAVEDYLDEHPDVVEYGLATPDPESESGYAWAEIEASTRHIKPLYGLHLPIPLYN